MNEITWREFLPDLLSSVLWQKIRNKKGERYNKSLYFKWLHYHKTEKFLTSGPSRSFFRLLNKNKCSYCNNSIPRTNGYGDHSVGKTGSIMTCVPCCRSCNSSKGKNDMIYWFCIKKGNDVLKLDKDVISIYVQGKYQVLKQDGGLDTFIPIEFHDILSKLHEGLEK